MKKLVPYFIVFGIIYFLRFSLVSSKMVTTITPFELILSDLIATLFFASPFWLVIYSLQKDQQNKLKIQDIYNEKGNDVQNVNKFPERENIEIIKRSKSFIILGIIILVLLQLVNISFLLITAFTEEARASVRFYFAGIIIATVLALFWIFKIGLYKHSLKLNKDSIEIDSVSFLLKKVYNKIDFNKENPLHVNSVFTKQRRGGFWRIVCNKNIDIPFYITKNELETAKIMSEIKVFTKQYDLPIKINQPIKLKSSFGLKNAFIVSGLIALYLFFPLFIYNIFIVFFKN